MKGRMLPRYAAPRCRIHVQDVDAPRAQGDIEAAVAQLVTAVFVALARQEVDQSPGPAPNVVPRHLDACLFGLVGQVHGDQEALAVRLPTPRQDGPMSRPVGPPAPVAQAPFAISKGALAGCFEQPAVEGREVGIDRLRRSAAEEDRHAHLAPFQLALVEQARAGDREGHHRGGPVLGGSEGRGGPRLVVVLDEPNQPLLKGDIGQQVQLDTLGSAGGEPVVEPFVVAVVEAQLL
jgi:hypothetical protein